MHEELKKKLLAEDSFGLLVPEAKAAPITSAERATSGFDEIAVFVERHGREPNGASADMAEARLAWRLDAIRQNHELCKALHSVDTVGLLAEPKAPASLEEVAAADPFGLLGGGERSDLFDLRHVPAQTAVKEKPDDVAQREVAEDFEQFRARFEQCHRELKIGARKLVPFSQPSNIAPGRFFLLNGMLVLVAEMGEQVVKENQKHRNARLRCVFENATQSNMLLQSLARQLYDGGKLVTESEIPAAAMPLASETDMAMLYVLRSKSSDPQVKAIPNLHKIGFTTGTTSERVRGAEASDTYLRAGVEVVEEYHVPAVIAGKLEHLLHRVFASRRLDIAYELAGYDISSNREWFSVPLSAIDEAVDLFESGAIVNFRYGAESQTFELD